MCSLSNWFVLNVMVLIILAGCNIYNNELRKKQLISIYPCVNGVQLTLKFNKYCHLISTGLNC